MKKLFIAWLSIIAMILLVLVLNRIPDRNPDFGYVYDDEKMLENSRRGFLPEPSGKLFDVVYYDRVGNDVKLHIRPNFGDELYVDRVNSKLEMRLFGTLWIDAPKPANKHRALGNIRMSHSPRVHGFYVLDADANFHSYGVVYRLKLAFTENEDGTGERYELKLRIEA